MKIEFRIASEDPANSDFVAFILGFFLAAAIGTIACFLVYESAEKAARKECLDAGVAEYTIDPKTGVRKFEWKNGE